MLPFWREDFGGMAAPCIGLLLGSGFLARLCGGGQVESHGSAVGLRHKFKGRRGLQTSEIFPCGFNNRTANQFLRRAVGAGEGLNKARRFG